LRIDSGKCVPHQLPQTGDWHARIGQVVAQRYGAIGEGSDEAQLPAHSAFGGAALAAELGAASADHLVKTSDADIAALAKSDTVAVALPCTPFGLAEKDYTPAKKIIEAGAMLALATDCNPGTSWNESMQIAIALACRYMKLTPAQAIAASTINSAHAIRRSNTIGSIEAGKQADMLILSVADYRQVGYRYGTNLVKQVIKRGHVYSVDVGYYRTA
jgi:imidazolonepropionase